MVVNFAMDETLNKLVDVTPTVGMIGGVILTIIGSGLMAIGNLMMKVGIHMESKRRDNTFDFNAGNCPYLQPMWLLGIVVYTIGAVLHALALAYAPASILAPMNSVGLILNAIIATMTLGEPFEMTEAVGTIGTIIGVSLCAASSFLPHGKSEIVSGLDSWMDPLYLVFISVCGSLAACLLLIGNSEEAKVADQKFDPHFRIHLEKGHIEMGSGPVSYSESSQSYQKTPLSGKLKEATCDALTAERTRLIQMPTTLSLDEPFYPVHLGMLYGFLAGLIGAQCILELKVFVTCIKAFFAGENIFQTYKPYLSSSLCLFTIALQMHFLNMGLGRGGATIVIPTYYVFWTIFGVLGGFAKFHEFTGFTPYQIVMFLAGVIITLFCVLYMAIKDSQKFDYEVTKAVEVLIGDELETEEARRSRLRSIHMSVPLGLGFGMIPAGRIIDTLGRAASRLPLRRTRSYEDVPNMYNDFNEQSNVGGHSIKDIKAIGTSPHHWTYHGYYLQNFDVQTSKPNASNAGIELQAKQRAERLPASYRQEGGGGNLVRHIVTNPIGTKHHRGLNDIVFLEDDDEDRGIRQDNQRVGSGQRSVSPAYFSRVAQHGSVLELSPERTLNTSMLSNMTQTIHSALWKGQK